MAHITPPTPHPWHTSLPRRRLHGTHSSPKSASMAHKMPPSPPPLAHITPPTPAWRTRSAHNSSSDAHLFPTPKLLLNEPRLSRRTLEHVDDGFTRHHPV
uniref:Uncharacterized protein n=1 Tax=Eutreptiella gymnastica TaxID=73025 RepID=A0A7S4LII9_9EUGL